MSQYENNQAAKQAQGLTITNPSTIAEILSNPRSLKTYFYLANHGYSELGYTWVDECNTVNGEIVVSTHRMPYLKTYSVLPNDAAHGQGHNVGTIDLGLSESAYWGQTINTLYEMHETKNLVNNMDKGKGYKSITGKIYK